MSFWLCCFQFLLLILDFEWADMQSQVVCSGCKTFLLYRPELQMFAVQFAMWDGNGSIDMWRLPHLAYACSWSNQCQVFLLSHCKSCARYRLDNIFTY
ncbi:hypothetical protein SASPL_152249 [Salvia splendens]|uniref:Secreted protein n=1 Tax=Salvia splendens TaxID=180675 RepID=A0A8X8W2R5_SALSN|nr:hypothetical protein SASPL_152249 [Salvia splendens]